MNTLSRSVLAGTVAIQFALSYVRADYVLKLITSADTPSNVAENGPLIDTDFESISSRDFFLNDAGQVLYRVDTSDGRGSYWLWDGEFTHPVVSSAEAIHIPAAYSLPPLDGPGGFIYELETGESVGDQMTNQIWTIEGTQSRPVLPDQAGTQVNRWVGYRGGFLGESPSNNVAPQKLFQAVLAPLIPPLAAEFDPNAPITVSNPKFNSLFLEDSTFSALGGLEFESSWFDPYLSGNADGLLAFFATGLHRRPDNSSLQINAVLKLGPEIQFITPALYATTDQFQPIRSIVGKSGHVAFKALDGDERRTTIFAENPGGGVRRVAVAGFAAPDTAEIFRELNNFQISERGLVTLWGQDSRRQKAIWTEVTHPDSGKPNLIRIIGEGDTLPPDSDLSVTQLNGGIANDRGEILFSCERKTLANRARPTSYWIARLNPETQAPEYEEIINELTDELTLKDGDVVRGQAIEAFRYNLRNSENFSATSFNNRGQVVFHVVYPLPDTFQLVDSLWLASPRQLSVDSTGDESDTNPGDGIADIRPAGSNGSPITTLRAAIEEANALGGSVKIDFSRLTANDDEPITIKPSKALPTITPRISIDGSYLLPDTTTDGFVILDGSSITTPTSGIKLDTNRAEISNLVIQNFTDRGIDAPFTDLHLDHVDLIGNGTDGVAANHLRLDSRSDRIGLVKGNGRVGVRTDGRLVIENYHILENGDWGIRTIGSDTEIRGIAGQPILIARNQLGGVNASLGIVHISDTVCEENGSHGLFLLNSKATLESIISRNNEGNGIEGRDITLLGQSDVSNNRSHGIVSTENISLRESVVSNNQRWGIYSSGDQISASFVRIAENGAGGVHATGLELELFDVRIEENGQGNISGASGYGIDAPNAKLAGSLLTSAVSIERNVGGGVRMREFSIDGTAKIHDNGGHGIELSRNLLSFAEISIRGNSGWGAIVNGDNITIQSDPIFDESEISSNLLGGIQFTGKQLEIQTLTVANNGSAASPNGGISAKQAHVNASGLELTQNHGVGLSASSLTLQGGLIQNQQGDGIVVSQGPLLLSSVVVEGNQGSGIVLRGTTDETDSEVSQVIFKNNQNYGISSQLLSTTLTVQNSEFLSNRQGGVQNETSNESAINAVDNFWGDNSGPSGSGPGQGDRVSLGVQFDPWQGQSPAPTLLLQNDAPIGVRPDTTSSLQFLIRAGNTSEEIRISTTNTEDWTLLSDPFTATTASGFARVSIPVIVPENVAEGLLNEVIITAEILTGPAKGDVFQTTIPIETYTPKVRAIQFITPSPTLEVGTSIDIEVQALDQFGHPLAFQPQWLLNGPGTLDSNGRYTATDTPGEFRIEASSLNGFAEFLFGSVIQKVDLTLAVSLDSSQPGTITLTLPEQRNGLTLEGSTNLIDWEPIQIPPTTSRLNLPANLQFRFYRLRQ